MLTSTRRGFLAGLTSLLAAPAVVRAQSLMPVRTPIIMRPRAFWIGDGMLQLLDSETGQWRDIGEVQDLSFARLYDTVSCKMVDGSARLFRGGGRSVLAVKTYDLSNIGWDTVDIRYRNNDDIYTFEGARLQESAVHVATNSPVITERSFQVSTLNLRTLPPESPH